MEDERVEWAAQHLVLCRSDRGDGGWSLHAPWATKDQIASGEEPYLVIGDGEPNQDGAWTRPNRLDYEQAMNVLTTRTPPWCRP